MKKKAFLFWVCYRVIGFATHSWHKTGTFLERFSARFPRHKPHVVSRTELPRQSVQGMVAEIVESTTSARCIQQIQRASDLRRVDVSLFAFQCSGFEDREGFQDGHGSLEVALYTVLSVCNLQRSCLLRQTFWDATQASCDHQKNSLTPHSRL